MLEGFLLNLKAGLSYKCISLFKEDDVAYLPQHLLACTDTHKMLLEN